METVFITGTGTAVGKTTICAALIQGLMNKKRAVAYYKPIQTGGPDVDSLDILTHCLPRIISSALCCDAAMSPDQAQLVEGKADMALDELVASRSTEWDAVTDWLVIEGAGGIQVPLNFRGDTWLDYLRCIRVPVLVVARNKLGMINHTSLSILALEHAGIDILGVIISGDDNPENVASLRRLHPDTAFHVFPSLIDADGIKFPIPQTKATAEFMLAQFKLYNEGRDSPALVQSDLDHVWHPYTQHQNASPPPIARSARGVYLELADSRQVLDGSASWWVNTVGHGRKEIGTAIVRQQQRLDHVIFANLTHQPGIQLAKRILQFADSHLDRVFFSDNGSTALEIALKMAYQACVNRGETEKTAFLAFAGSYHGDTFGAMSVGKADGFHGAFRKVLFRSIWANPVTFHKSEICPLGIAAYDAYLFALRSTIAIHHQALAGVVIEPLVQGAGGMLMQPERFLQDLANLCREFCLPLIFDEVFTGMGRIGDAFAFKRARVLPDIICLAKGLTGGTMPLALTLATDKIFTAFLSDDKGKALLHGHSYTGNPVACAAALATLKIIEKEDLVVRSRELEDKFSLWLFRVQQKFSIENPRCLGGILAFELPGSGFGNYFSGQAEAFTKAALAHGLFLRTLGNTAYFVPPLSINDRELELAFRSLEAALAEI